MAKDPAFLFYPGDFTTGTQFFTDEQVGKYMRLLMAQHQHGHLAENQVIFICKSYDKDIFSKLVKDSKGLWFNERLEIEIEKRKNYVASRSKNKEGKTKTKIISNSYDSHMENENRNENDIEILKEYDNWTEQILEGNDQHFQTMFINERIPPSEGVKTLIADHRDLLNRYPSMRPQNQHSFRRSCIKHIKENLSKQKNAIRDTPKNSPRRADAVVESGREFGKL